MSGFAGQHACKRSMQNLMQLWTIRRRCVVGCSGCGDGSRGEPPAAAVALLNELYAAVTHCEQMVELRKTDMKIATKELEVATHACSILKEYRCVEIP